MYVFVGMRESEGGLRGWKKGWRKGEREGDGSGNCEWMCAWDKSVSPFTNSSHLLPCFPSWLFFPPETPYPTRLHLRAGNRGYTWRTLSLRPRTQREGYRVTVLGRGRRRVHFPLFEMLQSSVAKLVLRSAQLLQSEWWCIVSAHLGDFPGKALEV